MSSAIASITSSRRSVGSLQREQKTQRTLQRNATSSVTLKPGAGPSPRHERINASRLEMPWSFKGPRIVACGIRGRKRRRHRLQSSVGRPALASSAREARAFA
jgi:hypothetical protein